MKARWRHRSDQADHQVIGLEHDGARAVLPGVLEPELERAVGQTLEPFLRNRRAGDVAAKPLELSAVAAVDRLFSVDVDAPMLGDGLVRSWLGLFERDGGAVDEPELGESGSVRSSV